MKCLNCSDQLPDLYQSSLGPNNRILHYVCCNSCRRKYVVQQHGHKMTMLGESENTIHDIAICPNCHLPITITVTVR